MLFISPRAEKPAPQKHETCLWTNCKSLVEALSAALRICGTTQQTSNRRSLKLKRANERQRRRSLNILNCRKEYFETVKAAEEEMLVMTSAQGLVELSKTILQPTKENEKDVAVRIMAPTMSDNLEAAKQLSSRCSVRHVPPNYLQTAIIDGKHLFQFKMSTPENQPLYSSLQFRNTLYSTIPNTFKK